MLKQIELETNSKSVFYNIDPLLKIATVAFISLFLIIVDSLKTMLVINIIAILLTLYARLTRRQYFFLLINMTFLIYGMAFSQGIFYQDYPRQIFMKFHFLGLENFPEIIIWKEGLLYGLKVSLRFIPNILLSFIIFTSTNPDDFLNSLNRFHIPHIISYMISISIRFIPILYENYLMVRSIQNINGYSVRFKNPIRVIKTELKLIVPVIFHAYRSAIHLAESMSERAFNPETKKAKIVKNYSNGERIYLATLITFLLATVILKLIYFLYLSEIYNSYNLRTIYNFTYKYL